MSELLPGQTASTDEHFMLEALRLACLGLGAASPNPCVGAVVVQGGEVIGRGGHRRAGEAHAEVLALQNLGTAAHGATVYSTLEPCAHVGRQPPCTQALIEAQVARVVIGMSDPDPRVVGRGVQQLREAGIEVVTACLEKACRALNPGYLHRQTSGRTRVLLKTATTLEGAVATHSGESQWITGAQARRRVHELRARMAAVMVGAGTARVDKPSLNVRLDAPLPWWRQGDFHPLRLVVSRSGEVPAPTAQGGAVWLLGGGAEVEGFEKQLHLASDWQQTLETLAQQGVNELLCEGGSGLASSLLAAGVVDEWVQMIAPLSLGGVGLAGLQGKGCDKLSAARRGRLARLEQLGHDACLWTVFDASPSFADQTALLQQLEP
ncbi:MAG: bifunctional diaminohydroxyphosphoribosylaminopyrimidine deaminase/5-amino-6-(5-phosphoribosylamino)uracil reductase RibD [Myxococcota bacterium]|nr:bifunctional diaminohydroxyphosphoribosylaminopyrimidine deaminase/5-amino-6-(5-phosphoribosylamino)uracil reductase RibD [Myxococcota bacterium]